MQAKGLCLSAVIVSLFFLCVPVEAPQDLGRSQPPLTTTGPATVDLREVIARAKDRVFPAVVFVKPTVEKFERGEKKTHELAGSGVIVSPTGEVLTNWHVVEKALRIRCLLFDGRSVEARLLGKDKETDLALLQLEGSEGSGDLPAAELGDSDLVAEGDFVMAMGAPWGMSRSVSLGIIMCTRRYIPVHSEYALWLQTDASLSPGNSGGPLVNVDGQVIGINTSASLYGGDLGFALPSNLIKELIPQLRGGSEIERSWTGLRLQPLNDFERDMYFGGERGVIVAGCDPGSPAGEAGLQVGDRIVRLNEEELTALSAEDLPAVRRRLAGLPRDRAATLEVDRAGESLSLSLTPRVKGEIEGEEFECKGWQMTVKVINQFADPDLYFHRQQGVFISGVKDPGNAEASGLMTKDIVVKIDGQETTTLDELKQVYERLWKHRKEKNKVVVEVIRSGLGRLVVLDYSWEYEE